MNRQKLLFEINRLLSIFTAQVKGNNTLQLTDINKHSEHTLIPLFSEIYGYKHLKNLNTFGQYNFPAVDLGDDEAKVAVQVTSETGAAKVIQTLQAFKKHQLHKRFNHLFFYILTEKKTLQSARIDVELDGSFRFDKSSDYRDYSDLLRAIEEFEPHRLQRVLNILEASFGNQAETRRVVYSSIPDAPRYLVGRDVILGTLLSELTSGNNAVLSSEGKAGVGKTTLAVALAHHQEVRDYFADGILWVSLGPSPQPENEQANWANALNIHFTPSAAPQDKKEILKQTIANRKLLIIIDDAWQTVHAELFRCGGPNCTYFLTTRDQDVARSFATPQHVIKINELGDDDAYTFLKQLAPEVCAAYPHETRALSDKLGGLPLAIELAGVYLSGKSNRFFKSTKERGLAVVSNSKERLEFATNRLGATTDQQQTLEQVISLSLEELDGPSRQAFYALGAFAPKPDTFDLEAAKAVTGADETTLANLLNGNLLDIDGNETLMLHQVLADVAKQQTLEITYQRHLTHYLDQVNRDRENWQRIQGLYPQLSHAAERLKALQAESFIDVMWALRIYHERRGLRQTELDWYEHGLELFRRNGNQEGEANVLNNIGLVYDYIGELTQALNYYELALPIRRVIGDRNGEATTLNNIAAAYNSLGNPRKALDYYFEALPILRETGLRLGEAIVLSSVGAIFDNLRLSAQALDYLNQSLSIHREIGSREGEAVALGNIASVYDNQGEPGKAVDHYKQALTILREIGDRDKEAATLSNIGSIYHSLGDFDLALEFLNQALPIQQEIGDRAGHATTLGSIGTVYMSVGNLEHALAILNQALLILRELGHRSVEGTTLHSIGAVYVALGEREQSASHFHHALDHFYDSLAIFLGLGERGREANALNSIGYVYDKLGDTTLSLKHYNYALSKLKEVGDRTIEADTRFNIAMVYKQQGNLSAAISELEKVALLQKDTHSQFVENVEDLVEELRGQLKSEPHPDSNAESQ